MPEHATATEAGGETEDRRRQIHAERERSKQERDRLSEHKSDLGIRQRVAYVRSGDEAADNREDHEAEHVINDGCTENHSRLWRL